MRYEGVIGNEKAERSGLAAQLEAVEKRLANMENKFAEFEERYAQKDFDRGCSSRSKTKLKRGEKEELEAVEKRVDNMENKFAQFEEIYADNDFDTALALRSCSSKKLKRREEEEYVPESKSKKDKICIFFHLVGSQAAYEYENASRLYKIEMDTDKYLNPSPSSNGSSKPSIEPVFNFTFKQRYPLGMACVLFGTKHHLYFMGGSITYTLYFNKSRREAKFLYDTVDATDPNMYPPNLYVFDCFTCRLLSHQDSPPPMNSGKSANSFTFVHKNKLYVLSSSTNVPQELHMFEVFDPVSCTWTILKDPPYTRRKLLYPENPVGSVLIDDVFFVSYIEGVLHDSPIHIFSYQISDNEWTEKLSVYRPLNRGISYVPTFKTDSVFVQNKLYSANSAPLFQDCILEFPILSYGPIPTTAKLDAYAFDAVATPNLTPIFPLDACWPTCNCGFEGFRTARLVHLGGLLQGTKIDTTCFGFLQVVDQIPDDRGLYIRFVAFEAFNSEITRDIDTYDLSNCSFHLPDEWGAFFNARTLHVSQFYSSVKYGCSLLNAACALIQS